MASRTARSFPTMTRWTFSSIRPSSSAARLGSSARSSEAMCAPVYDGHAAPRPPKTHGWRQTFGNRRADAIGWRQTCGIRGALAFHVGQLFRHLAVAHLEEADAADVRAAPVEPPAHHPPIGTPPRRVRV